MLLGVIVVCEIGFWLFLLAGLTARYVFRRRRVSVLLLAGAPLVDLVLLVLSTLDLRRGGAATTAHALAAVYIGTSVGFGDRMVAWADQRFAHHVAGGPAPARKPRYGAARADYERRMWGRHLLAWAAGCALLGLAILLVGQPGRTAALLQAVRLWTFVLFVDFLISFSYTLFPRRAPTANEPAGTAAPRR
jgi:hypothetical protein